MLLGHSLALRLTVFPLSIMVSIIGLRRAIIIIYGVVEPYRLGLRLHPLNLIRIMPA